MGKVVGLASAVRNVGTPVQSAVGVGLLINRSVGTQGTGVSGWKL